MFLNIINLIFSEEDVLIKVEISKTLCISLSSIDIILSFFCSPAIKAGLSFWTSLIIAGVKSLPINILIAAKIIKARTKLAIGPAATIIDL